MHTPLQRDAAVHCARRTGQQEQRQPQQQPAAVATRPVLPLPHTCTAAQDVLRGDLPSLITAEEVRSLEVRRTVRLGGCVARGRRLSTCAAHAMSVFRLQAELDAGAGIESLRRFNKALRAVPADKWGERWRPSSTQQPMRRSPNAHAAAAAPAAADVQSAPRTTPAPAAPSCVLKAALAAAPLLRPQRLCCAPCSTSCALTWSRSTPPLQPACCRCVRRQARLQAAGLCGAA